MTKRIPNPGEISLLRHIRQLSGGGFARSGVRLGIGDDCALLAPRAGEELAITTDLSLQDRHFHLGWHTPESIGHRALARGLSDLAAMGAVPMAAFLSLALPPARTRARGQAGSWMERFYAGLLALGRQHRTPLAGGDLSQSATIAADIVLVGSVPRHRALLRSAARPGDVLYVTGALGGAAAELLLLQVNPRAFVRATAAGREHPHLFPQPRLAVGQALIRRRLSRAALDISDGFSTDLTHLCEESGVQAVVESEAIPVHPLARAAEERGLARSALRLALHGGEDYELLFTAPPRVRVPSRIGGVAVTAIGFVEKKRAGRPLAQLSLGGRRRPLLPAGWEHFSR